MRFAPRAFISRFATTLLLAACGGGDGSTNPPSGNQGITLVASTTSGSVVRGGSISTTLTLGRIDGYAGAVELTATGNPNGVTVTFSPTTLTGSTLNSIATITVAPSITATGMTITLRASGAGVAGQSVAFQLTIPPPAITVSAGTGAVTAVQGTSVTVPITITRANGAAGNITLGAEGLPNNVTATFAPAVIPNGATTSTLTLTVGANATPAVSNVTVRAVATDANEQTATVALTIASAAAPAFTVTAAPAALSVVAGQSGNSVLTIAKTGGFAANVALTVEGAPAGVTGAFAPNPANGTTSTLTLNSTLATVPGTYNLTVRGTSAGLTDRTTVIAFTVTAAPGLTLAVAPTALTIAQGGTSQSVITLTRLGGLAGDVQMTATSATGITTAFAPATVTGTSSTLTVSASGVAAVGTSNVVITAAGAGGTTASVTLPVTVTAPAGFTLAATGVSVQQNALATSTITITRSGGFAGVVELTATGVPANVTAAFSPASAPAGTSALTFTAAANATPGTYTIMVNGVGGGANQSTTLTLTITSSAGGGNVAWRFCDATRVPVWFAYRDGVGGTWTRVIAGANNTFTFTIAQSVGSVVYVIPQESNTPQITQLQFTAAELIAMAAAECTNNPAGKSLTGTVAGLTAGQVADVRLAGSGPTVNEPLTTFSMTNVDDVASDLLAFRSTQTIGGGITTIPDRGILRRSVNYPANSAIPLLDFNAAESFAPASAALTVANTNADALLIATQFITGNGTSGSYYFGTRSSAATNVTQYGVPSSRTQVGDYHLTIVLASSSDATSTRTIAQYNRDVADRTLMLGAIFNAPTVSTTGSAPYARLRSRGSWQAEYGSAVGATFFQLAGGGKNWTIAASRGYFGGAATEFDVEIPDLSAVGGFSNAWALSAGATTTVTTSGASIYTNGPFAISEGFSYKQASRAQTVTP